MVFYDEIYFDIRVEGEKRDLKKFAAFLKSGELDEFFEFLPEYIDYEDDYHEKSDYQLSVLSIINDEYGIEVDEFDPHEFLELICKAGRSLDIRGRIYDADDDDFEFISAIGDSYYINARKNRLFNDELDERAYEEDMMED